MIAIIVAACWLVCSALGFMGFAWSWTRDVDLDLDEALLLGLFCLILGPLATIWAALLMMCWLLRDAIPRHRVVMRRRSR